jgi:hypothetical protein
MESFTKEVTSKVNLENLLKSLLGREEGEGGVQVKVKRTMNWLAEWPKWYSTYLAS